MAVRAPYLAGAVLGGKGERVFIVTPSAVLLKVVTKGVIGIGPLVLCGLLAWPGPSWGERVRGFS